MFSEFIHFEEGEKRKKKKRRRTEPFSIAGRSDIASELSWSRCAGSVCGEFLHERGDEEEKKKEVEGVRRRSVRKKQTHAHTRNLSYLAKVKKS